MNGNANRPSSGLHEDETLVLEFQAGRTGVFDQLVARHRDRIFNLCYWLTGDYQEAEEVAQDVFMKAYGGLPNFQRKAAFSTWLHRIAVNTCKNRMKSLAFRFKKMTRSFADGGGNEDGFFSQNDGPTPLDALEQKETAEALKQALKRLAKDKRIVLVLREIEGLSYEQIAEVTGFALGTVKSKLARARADLLKKLKQPPGTQR